MFSIHRQAPTNYRMTIVFSLHKQAPMNYRMTSIDELSKYLNLRAGEAVASAWCRGSGRVEAVAFEEELLGTVVGRGGVGHVQRGGASHA
jgi:hypothetical protein